MMSRLLPLADAGDRDAAFAAGMQYYDAGNPYGLMDYRLAAERFEYVLASADPSNLLDPYVAPATEVLIRMCGSVNREDWNDQCL